MRQGVKKQGCNADSADEQKQSGVAAGRVICVDELLKQKARCFFSGLF
jgi:hypothetical protein